jgi:hypothetical protein
LCYALPLFLISFFSLMTPSSTSTVFPFHLQVYCRVALSRTTEARILRRRLLALLLRSLRLLFFSYTFDFYLLKADQINSHNISEAFFNSLSIAQQKSEREAKSE